MLQIAGISKIVKAEIWLYPNPSACDPLQTKPENRYLCPSLKKQYDFS